MGESDLMSSNQLKMASEWLYFNTKRASSSSSVIKFACQAWVKTAFGNYLVQNKQHTESQYYYTAWAALHALGETTAEPSSSTNPSNYDNLQKQLKSKDPAAHRKIIQEWKGEGGKAWGKLLKKGAYIYRGNPDHQDFGTEIYVRYFLTPHSQNSATPDPPRTSMGLSPSQLKGGVWYRLHKNPGIFSSIASAIGSVMGYINSQHNPKGVRKVKTTPGNQVDEAIVSGFAPEDFKGDEMDSLAAPDDYRDDMEDLIVEGRKGLIPTDIDPMDPDYIKHIKYNLGIEVNRMVDEDWMFIVGLKWNDGLIQQIAEVCSEVSSSKLAPLVIKRFSRLTLPKLKSLVDFVDECIDPNHRYFGEKRAGKTIYFKRLRKYEKSVPQWVNLFLAVNGPFTVTSGGRNVVLEGSLHGGPTAWSTMIRNIVNTAEDPEHVIDALWSAVNGYMPVESMMLDRSKFKATMLKYTMKFQELKLDINVDPDIRFRSFCKGLFKEKDKTYLESIIAVPMAEATRMRLIQLVLPKKFEKELTTNNYITCGQTLRDLLDIPKPIVDAVRDLTSDVVVDEVISEVKDTLKGAGIKVAPQ
jgi:hypothetical protein